MIDRPQGFFAVAALLLAALICPTGSVLGTITWPGGPNPIPSGTTSHASSLIITSGTNLVVQGASGGGSAGVLQLDANGTGLEITGSTITLNSDATLPGKLALMGPSSPGQVDLTCHASATTSAIVSGGVAAVPGKIDSNGGTRIYNIEAGTVPNNGPDLSISATIINSGVRKQGAGIMALSGNNTYNGGTTLEAGKLYINSATALGNGPLTISGNGTSIDNTSGVPITLSNNNPINVFGDGLTFVGTNDLNFGTGDLTINAAPSRTVTVVNASATLTLGGFVADNGHDVALIKDGAGKLLLTGEGIYGGGTSVNGGTLELSSTGQINPPLGGNGTVTVGVNGTFIDDGQVKGDVVVSGVLVGHGTINGALTVNSGGIVDLNGETLTVNGAITNNGLFVLSNGAQLAHVTMFTNNGVLDISTEGTFTPPNNFTNNGTIIDSSVVTTKTASRTGTTMTVTIDSYTGHTYQLQKSTTTPDTTSFTTNVGSSQQGTTGNVLSFTDPSATGTKAFYRIAVDP